MHIGCPALEAHLASVPWAVRLSSVSWL